MSKTQLTFSFFLILISLGFGTNQERVTSHKASIFSEIGDDIPQAIKKNIRLKSPLQIEFAAINDWLRTVVDAKADTDFEHLRSFDDQIGFTHHRYQQTFQGIPVQDGIFIVHQKDGNIVAANGEYYPEIDLSPSVRLTPAEAIAIGKQSVEAELWAWEDADFPQPEIQVILSEQGYRCAYKTDLFAFSPHLRKWLYIEVATGEIVAERNQITHITVPGEAHCFHHGLQTIMVDSLGPNEFVLRDYSRGNGIVTRDLNGGSDFNAAVDFVDDDNVWDTTTDFDDAALDVHWATGLMYDYMLEAHSWDSYDNQGAVINSYIHHSNNFNANWNGSGMQYGDGNGTLFNPLTAAEVVGHEFMHGYSSTIVGWNNSNMETASLNEAYSDIFSVIVEFNKSPSTANYLIGDMVTVSGEPLRSMEDPKSLNDADTYQGENWSATNLNTNAGVYNFCFYLLTQGGEGTNDNGDSYSVAPIPMADAADIFFRALSVYMTPNAIFPDVREHGIQACIDLYGPCSEQEIQFTNACYAVGIGSEYAGPPITQINFTGDTDVDESIAFTSNATMASSWVWNFGDGNTSNEEMPSHVYQTMGDYEITLAATYNGGCVMTDTINITIGDITSTQDLAPVALSIFPNPAHQWISVEVNTDAAPSQFRVINALGQVMPLVRYEQLSAQSYQLALDHLPRGIYLLELEWEDRSVGYQKFYLNQDH